MFKLYVVMCDAFVVWSSNLPPGKTFILNENGKYSHTQKRQNSAKYNPRGQSNQK